MPNQPKTPISSFRIDDETKASLRALSELMGTTMTEVVQRSIRAAEDATVAAKGLAEAVAAADPPVPPLVAFVRARLLEDDAALPPKGDDPSLPYGQHWSEVPFPMAAAFRAKSVLRALWNIVEQVADVEWGGYAVRDVVLEHIAYIYRDHEDYREEWRP